MGWAERCIPAIGGRYGSVQPAGYRADSQSAVRPTASMSASIAGRRLVGEPPCFVVDAHRATVMVQRSGASVATEPGGGHQCAAQADVGPVLEAAVAICHAG